MLSPALSIAETTGLLTGLVLDAKTLKPMSGATVVVFQEYCPTLELCRYTNIFGVSSSREFTIETTTSDHSGFFAFVSLNPGVYKVRGIFGSDYHRYVSFPNCPPTAVVQADATTSVTVLLSPQLLDIYSLPLCVAPDATARPARESDAYSFDENNNPE